MSDLNYQKKYLKYKNKYLNLKNSTGGASFRDAKLPPAIIDVEPASQSTQNQCKVKGKKIEIKSGQYFVEIDRSKDQLMDWKDWAKKVLWYGYRKGNYISPLTTKIS